MAPLVNIQLKPAAGWCFKVSSLEPGLLPPRTPQPPPNAQTASSSSPGGLLEPTANQPIPIPAGMKVFVNIAFDKNVPPPPPGSEEAIQAAMQGEAPVESIQKAKKGKENVNGGWYVPIIVSEPRLDKDKAGKPSLVVDCIYNNEVKSRALRDPAFKLFLEELALQRTEHQTSLAFSRKIGRPNILSKGPLKPRTVKLPASLLSSLPPPDPSEIPVSGENGIAYHPDAIPLVSVERNEDDWAPPPPPPKGILKKPAIEVISEEKKELDYTWSWGKLPSGKLQITIRIPDLSTSSIRQNQTHLDIEPRRFILSINEDPESKKPAQVISLDRTQADSDLVNAIHAKARARVAEVTKPLKRELTSLKSAVESATDEKRKEQLRTQVKEKEAEIAKKKDHELSEGDKEVTAMLLLKREREFEVDEAVAEWRVASGILVVTC
ncbi:hypothetical protein CC2G_002314 [Coprinopsis cinerea AmutBmut pab1-1]|nr:hypothetical protein CC2G_002314 [Coprinopsis cinerea AmutBmut pab1-1]